MFRTILKAAACGMALLWVAGGAGAATITWGAAKNITGDTDVSTTGTLVGAVHFDSLVPTTVNGVTFQGLITPGPSNTVGNFNLSSTFFFGPATPSGSAAAPFSSLSTAYKALLGFAAKAGAPMTLTMNGLTLGQNYQFQTWVNDSEQFAGNFPVDVSGGANHVMLNPNPSLTEGGLGQFVIGTFTADATSQQVGFFNSEVSVVNGFQLRALPAVNPGPGPAVPLPPAVWTGLVTAAGLACFAARRRLA